MKIYVGLILAAFCLQGCVSTERTHDSPIAWRRATVVQFGTADALGPPSQNDCRDKGDGRVDDPAKLFVVVQYFSGRTSVVRIVPLEPGEAPVIGELIEISRFGCRNAHVPRPS